ncbi:TRAP transporter small permease subunit [Corallincola holothuriorum]|uniref:TRAP transporter small permease subunit n=1 Tax=Corallincola holothuriorum TaxID=2282215 RepID=UPI0011C058FC|nr:TRAP transporter small permease subunit [Corallincola holothuriorum]
MQPSYAPSPSALFSALNNIRRIIDRGIRYAGDLVAWCGGIMMLLIMLIVVLRYLFNLGWIALQESVMYLHATAICFGAAYTLQQDKHVRVDIFYRRFNARQRAWLSIGGTLCLLMPMCSMIFSVSWPYVMDSWLHHESSQETGGLSGLYLFKSLLLVLPTLLYLQGVSWIISALECLFGPSQGRAQ